MSLVLSGCDFSPFCLDCADVDLRAGTKEDGGGGIDLLPTDDGGGGGDLLSDDLGPCVQTNSGVEICDSIDNDCNGTVDDVAADKLAADPRNCGACGTLCNFLATHQFGACVGGDVGTPHCEATDCVPGFADIDDQVPGCEYACFATGTEVCDGIDNDCNGTIDDGFGYPTYATNLAHCGGCGQICARPGANVACEAGTEGNGVCVVTSCKNEPDVETFNHNGDAATRNLTGCEYKCPTPSKTAGDCFDPSGGCTFDEELCDGSDNDCNFLEDDNVTDVGQACATHCPGQNCVGTCTPGATVCSGGVAVCQGGLGPVDDICDGLDNNCDGNVDELFRNPAALGGPAGSGYNLDAANCGGCFDGTDSDTNIYSCATQLNNSTVGCQPLVSNDPTSNGTCYVVSCDAGYAALPSNTTCGAGPNPTLVGMGCNYKCPVYPPRSETCNGLDDDCDGCVDEPGEVPLPDTFCASEGQCKKGTGTSNILPTCLNGALKCNYKAVAATFDLDVDPDDDFKLADTEAQCDNKDNNCNGTIDSDGFPLITTPATQCADNALGECQKRGQFECNTAGTATECKLPLTGNTPQPELCDGKDNDCDGSVDEPKLAPGTNATFYVVDDMVQIPGSTAYVYRYEASKPDASKDASGSSKARSCSKNDTLPWVSVTWDEAKKACEDAGYRLCTENEWQQACNDNTPARLYPYGVGYDGDACNGKDYKPVCAAPDDFEQVLPTGTLYGCTGPSVPAPATCATPSGIVDMSGNVKEWTSTQRTSVGPPVVISYAVRGGAYDNIASGLTCDFQFLSLPPASSLGTVGFRCCSDSAP